MRNLILVLAVLTCLGCEKKDEAQASNPTKTVFTTWKDESGNIYDFSEASLDAQGVLYLNFKEGNDSCECVILFEGTEENGNLKISKCLYSSESGQLDYGVCTGIEDDFKYTRNNGNMELCSTTFNECEDFKH